MKEVMISGRGPMSRPLVVTDAAANIVALVVASGCGRHCDVNETLAKFEVMAAVEGAAEV